MGDDVSRAMARVLRHDDVNKIWFRNVEEGVVETMVRDVIQDGAGLGKRERLVFVFKDKNDNF